MTKKQFFLPLVFASLMCMGPRAGSAQFVTGKVYVGPDVGLSWYGSTVAYGINLEIPVTAPGVVGPGSIGIAARADYYGYDYSMDNHVTWTMGSLMANYHFWVGDGSFDPFLGGGAGYAHAETDDAPYGRPSGIYPVAYAGMRYFFSPRVSAMISGGFGPMSIGGGLNFGL